MFKNVNVSLCRVLSVKCIIRSLSGAFNCLSCRALERSLRKCVHLLELHKINQKSSMDHTEFCHWTSKTPLRFFPWSCIQWFIRIICLPNFFFFFFLVVSIFFFLLTSNIGLSFKLLKDYLKKKFSFYNHVTRILICNWSESCFINRILNEDYNKK